jgi:hypothetical protein
MTSLAVLHLGVGLRRPCRGQTCGGMLGAMARIAPARPATPPNGTTTTFTRDRSAFPTSLAARNLEPWEADHLIFSLAYGTNSANSPCSVAAFVVNSEARTGARLSVRECAGLIIIIVIAPGSSVSFCFTRIYYRWHNHLFLISLIFFLSLFDTAVLIRALLRPLILE